MNDTTEVTSDLRNAVPRPEGALMALAIVWCREEPARVGEVLLVPPGDAASVALGRAGGAADERRATFLRQRPGVNESTGELRSKRLSRLQLRIHTLDEQRIAVDNVGRRPMTVNGAPTQHAVVVLGDVLELVDEVVLLAIQRPELIPAVTPSTEVDHPFGQPDRLGLVGESPAMWRARDEATFVGRHGGHVLVTGGPGDGRTALAQAIHAASGRARPPVVVRQLSTIPKELVAAELYGHAAGYAGFGPDERQGLLGSAGGTTLVLDDLCEAEPGVIELVYGLMDDGRYTRLGDVAPRQVDTRVVVTCEGEPSALPAPLVRRCRHVVRVPKLADRREDIGLLVAHLLSTGLADHPDLGARFTDARGVPRTSPELLAGLARHAYTGGVRELEALLWQGIARSTQDVIEAPPSLATTRRASLAPSQRPADIAGERALPDGLPESVRRGLAELSKAELLVLQHLALNKTSRQIARSLFLSVRTIQNHRARICERLGLRGNNRLLGVALALADVIGKPAEG